MADTKTTHEQSIANAKRSEAAVGGPLIGEGLWDYCFMMHPANSYRTYDEVTLAQSDRLWLPGDFITATGTLATSPANIAGINCQFRNTQPGAQATNAVTRDCEVADAYLQYGEMDPAAVATRLATLGIIVRQAVLPNVRGGSFDPNAPGPPVAGIPPATEGASYAPDTLEAANPAMKADDHGRVSAAEQQEHKAKQPPPPPAAAAPPHETGSAPPHRGPRPRGEG